MKTTPITTARCAVLLGSAVHIASAAAASPEPLRALVAGRVEAEYPSLFSIYTNLQAHPELSFMEVKTAALVAGELRALGFTVTEKVGNTGGVGVLTNGVGPTVVVRADLDGLPVPSNPSATFAPVPEPPLKTCVTSMTAAVLELMGDKSAAKEPPTSDFGEPRKAENKRP